MRYRSTFLAVTALVLGFCLGVSGCARTPSEAPAAPPIPVTVSYAVEREVTDYADFTARTAAVDSVEVRAHVWGYLEKVNFKEGALVQKGDVLFELDPRPYQAMLDQAKAKVRQDEAQLAFDEAEYQRNVNLVRTGAVSRSDLDKTAAARGVDLANIAADKAVVAARQPLRRHGGQPDPIRGPERRHAAHHHRVGGPDVRLLRRGRAHRAAPLAVDPRGQGQVGQRDPVARGAGPGHRG